MNVEVEVKIKVDNFEEIREKVSALGKSIKSIKQIDDYYIPCHRDFFSNKPHPVEWLRIRTNPDGVIFEYDKSVNAQEDGNQEYAEEYETDVSNPEELKKILAFLDFKKIVTVEKQREYWICGNLEIVLDDIKGLGYFVEAEAKGDFGSITEARRECINFLKKLGIKDVEGSHIKKGYPVMLLEKNEKK
jgi:adenylate cyclase class 2